MAKYHFIGIGGIGMGKLASLLLSKGLSVSGSDVKENKMVLSLRSQGAEVTIGHDAMNINGAESVVYSSAIKPENPELQAAREKGCRILRRAELLAELIRDYKSITVAGAHGKTTTTSMIAHVLLTAGFDPTVALGGIFQQGTYEESLGKGKYFVAELDESDGSFLLFSPDVSVVTNIDFEHVDYYGSWEKILEAYRTFIERTSDNGLVIACGDDTRLREIASQSSAQVVFYGFDEDNGLYARDVDVEDGETHFTCFKDGQELGRVALKVFGQHNVLNALACISASLHTGIVFSDIVKALASYKGVHRRFELKGKWADTELYDDYAHHPTEIRSTLEAARQLHAKRIIAVFQPHRYTRTKFLWEEFKSAFADADKVFVTDVYAASEECLSGIDMQALCDGIAAQSGCCVSYLKKEDLSEEAALAAQPGDLIITLGAGDITKVSDQIASRLEEKFMVHYE